MRKLASIQIIQKISAHSNPKVTSLEVAHILGWQVVVRKDVHKEGEKVVYLEIDSVCPKAEWSEFLEKHKYRVRTIKMMNELSQGLILPLSVLFSNGEKEWQPGDDVTELLKITKFEADEYYHCDNGALPFPTNLGIQKTDEPRIQSETKMLQAFKGEEWYATLKYDGTSSTYFIDPFTKEFSVCTRNNKIPTSSTDKTDKIDKNHIPYLECAKKYKLDQALAKYPHIVIQGEIYGPKINKNRLESKEVQLAVFTMFNIHERTYLSLDEALLLCKEMNLEHVEVIQTGAAFDFTIGQLLEMAKGKYKNSTYHREGLVFRLRNKQYVDGMRASFKVINNDYILEK